MSNCMGGESRDCFDSVMIHENTLGKLRETQKLLGGLAAFKPYLQAIETNIELHEFELEMDLIHLIASPVILVYEMEEVEALIRYKNQRGWGGRIILYAEEVNPPLDEILAMLKRLTEAAIEWEADNIYFSHTKLLEMLNRAPEAAIEWEVDGVYWSRTELLAMLNRATEADGIFFSHAELLAMLNRAHEAAIE